MAAGDVKLTVQLQAQDRATKVIRSTHKANEELIRSMIKAGAAQTRLGARVAVAIKGQSKLRAGLIRSADAASKVTSAMMSLKGALAGGAIAAAGKMAFEMAKDGAKAADQYRILNDQIGGLPEIISRAKKATAGMATQKSIVQAAAEFRAFGLDVQQIPEALGAVAMTSLRTGKSVDHLTESLSSGVARLSDMRLDNLGLIGVVSRAREELKAQGGSFDDTALRAKALSIAIEQLNKANEGIKLAESQTAQLEQLETAYAELQDRVSQYIATQLTEYIDTRDAQDKAADSVRDAAEAFADAREDVELFTRTMERHNNRSGAYVEASIELREATREQETALGAMVKELDRVEPAMRIQLWGEFKDTMAATSEATRAQVKRVLRLRAAYASLAAQLGHVAVQAAAALPALAGDIAGGLSAHWSTLQQAVEKGIKNTEGQRQKSAAKEAKRASTRFATARRQAAAARDALKERTEELKHQIALLRAQDELAKAELTHAREIVEATKRIAKVKDDAAKSSHAEAAETLALLKLNKELDAILARQAQIAEKAREDAQRQAEIDAENRTENLAAFGDRVAGTIGTAATLLRRMDAELSALGHPERYQNVAQGMAGLAASIVPAALSFQDLAKSSMAAGDKIAQGVATGLGTMGPAVSNFISGVKEQALVMGAFEAAQAVAWSFIDVPQAISHGIASGMFFALAGMASAQPTTPAAAAPTAAPGGRSGGGGGSGDLGTVVVNIGEGLVFGRPAEIGRAVAERMATMNGTGMEATAF